MSDEEFDKALKQVDQKVNKWKNWAEKRKIPKGEEFSQSNETEILNNEQEKSDNSLPVLTFPFELKIGELTDDEREIILSGCLINYYREK